MTQQNKEHRAASGEEPFVDNEIADFLSRPVFAAIAERLGEIAKQRSHPSANSLESKALDRRFRKLAAYVLPPTYDSPRAKQESLISSFARALTDGTFGKNGKPIRNWDEVKTLTDSFADEVRRRPVGHPVDIRRDVLKALELKLATPTITWAHIHTALKFTVTVDDLKRQIRLLKQLLKEEGIRL